MGTTRWQIILDNKASGNARALAGDLRTLARSLRDVDAASDALPRLAARQRATRAQSARTTITDEERVRRAVAAASVKATQNEQRDRLRAWNDRVRREQREQARVARLNAQAFRRDQALLTREHQRAERQRARATVQAQRDARRDAAAEASASSARRRTIMGGVLGGGALALGAGIGIAGATLSALGTMASLAQTAGELAANVGGSVLQMIALREASITTLAVMARSATGQRLTGAAAQAQARDQLRWAQQFARETPLEASQVLDLQRQTSAAGFFGARNRDVVSAAADVGAFNPNDEGAASRFLLGLGQLRNASTVRLQDLRQTTSAAGLSESDVLRQIARQAGITQRTGESETAYNSRLQQMQQRGRFTGAQGVEGVLAALRERNGGELGSFARAQGNSLMGTLSNLRGAVFDFVTSIDGIENLPGIRALKKTLNGFVGLLTGTSATTERMRAMFSRMVDDAARFVSELGGKGIDGALGDALDLVEELYPLVTATARGFGVEFWRPVSREIRGIFAAFTAGDPRERAAEIVGLGRALGNLLSWGLDVTAGMLKLAEVLTRVAGGMADMADAAARNPEMVADLQRELDPYSSSNLLAFMGIGNTGFGDLRASFSDFGRQIPAGMSEGIIAGRENVLADLSNLNRDIVAQSQADLQIHSPSRLFEWQGSMIAAGLAGGIEGGAGQVHQALGATIPTEVPAGAAMGRSVTIGELHVHTQAVDSAGIVRDLREQLMLELEGQAL